MEIRLAREDDEAGIWTVLEPVIRAGETYALDPDMTEAEALAYWTGGEGKETFVAVRDGRVLGTYFLRPNQPGGGAHVGNCGYMTSPEARGQGVARAMRDHSVARARERGFRAVQFNFVVSVNQVAVRLWQAGGFEIVGTLPGAFRHPRLGYVDVYVMYQVLEG
ncbi:GNAT family N-acetyltransferase [Sphingosinicella terrae]|uniref:GNAT family N-acetyltransferase n=1 Tax=Sphingosinicella terrae TaxID=2172047 RepID=UPI000E0DBA55|nr:GNAT family N-acetyltransferase [Sphingosinicella terrae]